MPQYNEQDWHVTPLYDVKDVHTADTKLWDSKYYSFLACVYDNSYAKWCHAIEWWKEQKAFGKTIPSPIKKTSKVDDNGNVVRTKEKDPFHDCKYSTNDGGQNSLVSWNQAGIDYWMGVYKQLKKIRKDPTKKRALIAVDTQVQEMLKEAYEKKHPSGKKSRKKRTLAAEEAPKKKSKLSAFAEESDDESVAVVESDDE